MAKVPEKAAPRGNAKKGLQPSKTAKGRAAAETPADMKPVIEEPEHSFPWPRSEVFGIRAGERKPRLRLPVTVEDRRAAFLADGLRAEWKFKYKHSTPAERRVMNARLHLQARVAENNFYQAMVEAGVWPTEEDRFYDAVMQAARGDLSDLANYLLTTDKPLHPEIAQAIGFILQGNLLPPTEWGGAQYRVEAVAAPIEPIRQAIRQGELVEGAAEVRRLIEEEGLLFSAAVDKVRKDIKCSLAKLRETVDAEYPELQSEGGQGPGARQQVKRLAAGARKKKQASREE